MRHDQADKTDHSRHSDARADRQPDAEHHQRTEPPRPDAERARGGLPQRECVERGYFVSVAGVVTFKNARDLRDVLAQVPLENLLVETDAPYLTPSPHRGATNAPALVPLTVRALAEVKNVDVSTLCAALSENSERVYGPW